MTARQLISCTRLLVVSTLLLFVAKAEAQHGPNGEMNVLLIGNSQLENAGATIRTALKSFSELVNNGSGKLIVTSAQGGGNNCNQYWTNNLQNSIVSGIDVVVLQPSLLEIFSDGPTVACWDRFVARAQSVGARVVMMAVNTIQGWNGGEYSRTFNYALQSDVALDTAIRNYTVARGIPYIPADRILRTMFPNYVGDGQFLPLLDPWYDIDHQHPGARSSYGYLVSLYQGITGRTSISTPSWVTGLKSPEASPTEMATMQDLANKFALGEPVAVAKDNVVDVFFRHANSALDSMHYQPNTWTNNGSLGLGSSSTMLSDASPVITSAGVVDVFWKGADNNLWHRWFVGGSWNGPGSLGPMGTMGGAPQAVGQTNGNVDVFWRDGSNNLVRQSYPSWAAPIVTTLPTAARMVSDASPINSSAGVLDVFWKGADNNLWHVWKANGVWNAPDNRGGGPLGSAPRAVGQSNGNVNVFWCGTDNQLWTMNYVPGGASGTWSATASHPNGTFPAGGQMASPPSPTVSSPGVIEVVWKGFDGNLWHQRFENGWQTAASLGSGPLASAPRAVGQANGVVDVFWRGTDNRLWKKTYFPGNGAWSPPSQQLAGNFIN